MNVITYCAVLGGTDANLLTLLKEISRITASSGSRQASAMSGLDKSYVRLLNHLHYKMIAYVDVFTA